MAHIIWFPLSRTLDTLEATDTLSDTLLPFDRLKSETRRYVMGERKPHYPVPTLLGTSAFYPECVVIHTPGYLDEVPGITWWNESYGIPLPADHGQWNPN